MRVAQDLAQLIGHTPLIKLRKASEMTGCTILGKAEFLNPGQSVKDRAAYYIIRDAVERGLLEPGGTIVEGTAGNTGIGLALVGASMGYKTVIVIPETQSQEKKDMIRLAGAELVQVPAAPYKNPNNYVHYSGRLAEQMAKTSEHGAIWAQQFDNVANRRAHVETTGPEIWDQTGGKVDGFICSVGSGGTLGGGKSGIPAACLTTHTTSASSADVLAMGRRLPTPGFFARRAALYVVFMGRRGGRYHNNERCYVRLNMEHTAIFTARQTRRTGVGRRVGEGRPNSQINGATWWAAARPNCA